jgi:hypothetical protein
VSTPQTMELVPQGERAVAKPDAGGMSIEQVFNAVVEKNLNAEQIGVMKELLAMDAQRKFAAAFVALQSELPTIVAATTIPNRGKYEKFEDVMKAVGPYLQKYGFTVSFSMDFKDNRILETCHLTHGGHTRSNTFAVRTRKADSDTQADCMAATTAKRNALLNALNIVIRQDCMSDESDAGIEGDYITKEQAFELERRVGETNSNKEAFLRYAEAAKFSEISSSRYAELDASLKKKERQGR